MAAFNLGNLLMQQRKYDRAEQACQQAIDSGHPAAAPAAELVLQWLHPTGSEESG